MQKIKDLNDVSAFLFFLLGFYYIVLVLMFRNDFYPAFSLFLMRMSDLPFVLVSLLYGGTSLSLQLEQGDNEIGSPWGVLILASCLLLFGAAVFLNFAFPAIGR